VGIGDRPPQNVRHLDGLTGTRPTLTNLVIGIASLTLYGWIAEWNTTSVPNGTYTLNSVATEVGGTTVTSPPITITVSN
jgi:hypothetical protein